MFFYRNLKSNLVLSSKSDYVKTLIVYALFILLLIQVERSYSSIVESVSKGVTIEYSIDEKEYNSPFIIIDEIVLEGNRITKPHIISRELLFKSGDTLLINDFEKLLIGSRENLLNTSLFNFVDIHAVLNPQNGSVINVSFVERWYLWPFPTLDIHERNVNSWLENPSLDRVSYGFYLVKDNFRGRMERIRLNFRAGYNERLSFSYNIPYLNYKQTWGLTFSAGYVRTREVNVMSLNNRQVFYKNPLEPVRTALYAQANFTHRKDFYLTHYFSLRYNYYEFADILLQINPQFVSGTSPNVQFIGLKYEAISDYRDIKAYPLQGHFNKLTVSQQGLNTFKNDVSPVFSLASSHRRYWQLYDKWYFASGLNTKVSIGKNPPYFLQQGLGYRDDFVRGYEYYVIDSQHFAVLKTNLKYNLVPQRTKRISFIPGNRFGLLHYAIFINAFVDAGYTFDSYFYENNPYSNAFLGGTGIGIDFVTYYDKVFRTEFTYNRHGRFDVYFHLVAPI